MQVLKQAFAVCTASALLSIPFAGNAQSSMDHSKMDHVKPETSQTIPSMSDGEVRRVDLETGKITIRHGYIKHLDMPSMTMIFTAKEKGLLTDVKPGDKIKFMVVDEAGKMVVTAITPAQ